MEEPSDIRRRLERVETTQSDIQVLLRESIVTNARLNESLIDLKDEFRLLRSEQKDVDQLKIDVSAIKIDRNACQLRNEKFTAAEVRLNALETWSSAVHRVLLWVIGVTGSAMVTIVTAYLISKFGMSPP